jgi:hypothetical protein
MGRTSDCASNADDLERTYQQAIADEERCKTPSGEEATQRREEVASRLEIARKSAEDLEDDSTAEIEKSLIEDIDLGRIRRFSMNATKRERRQREASRACSSTTTL